MRTEETKDNIKEFISDASITTSIKAKFAASDLIKSLDIHVETNKGEVTLTGTVPSKAALNKAKEIAQDIRGVNKVIADLEVED